MICIVVEKYPKVSDPMGNEPIISRSNNRRLTILAIGLPNNLSRIHIYIYLAKSDQICFGCH